jgi:hypothetical protein
LTNDGKKIGVPGIIKDRDKSAFEAKQKTLWLMGFMENNPFFCVTPSATINLHV